MTIFLVVTITGLVLLGLAGYGCAVHDEKSSRKRVHFVVARGMMVSPATPRQRNRP